MNLDILGNWKGGAISDAGDEAIRKYGKDAINNIDIGLLESAYGATDDHVRNYIKNKQQGALNDSALRARAINAGLVGADGSGGADFGDTTGSFLAKIVKQEKAVSKQDKAQARIERKEDNTTALNSQLALGKQTIDANAEEGRQNRLAAQDQYLHSSNTQEARYAHERSEGRLDRRHQAELADSKEGLQMQMAIMQNDLAEKRMDYDRETARMDKRSAAIAQLMSGLGSLGGAFSL